MRNKADLKNLYLQEVFSKEDPILQKIREYSEKEGVKQMQISAYEGGILQFLAQTLQVKKAIEIGTLYGYSSLMLARALPEKAQLFTLDIDSARQEKAQELMQEDPAANKIQFISGPALESLKKLAEEVATFDLIFIDADKAGYLNYLHWSSNNLKKGGLLIADNTFLFGAVYGEPERKQNEKSLQVMRQFNKELAKSGLYISTLIPTAEGLTVGIRI